jgi:ABC-type uncharacterized transport system involved in gliding motility auxiliary subunit
VAMNDAPETPGGARSQEGALARTSPVATVGLVGGVLGLTAAIFGVVLYALDPDALPLAAGNLLVGVVGLAFYAATNWRSLLRAVGGRSTTLVVLEVAIVAGVLAALATLNFFAAQEPKEWDLTRDKLFTLQEQSVQVAQRLDKKVTVYGFFRSSESARQVLEESVNLYKLHTDKLELVFINPDAPPPELIQKLDLNNASPRIVFESETGQVAKVRNATEEDLTNALIKVAERPARKVYFLTGHGEPAIDDAQAEDGYAIAASQLRNEGLTVEALSLLDRENVPKDASVVVVAGAKSALFPNEVETLKVWLNRGGRLVALLEPDLDYGMESIWRPFGVLVGDDLVLEPNPTGRAKGFGYESPVITAYEPHPITNKLKSAASLLYRARSVQPKVGLANLEVVTLFQTSPTSWGEVSWREGGPPERSEGDVPGPVPLAVAVTKKTATVAGKVNDEARMVVVGDLHFANNRFLPMGAHRDLFVNMTSWVIGDEDRIAVRPKSRSGDRLPITETQQYGIMFFSVNLLPLLIVGFGFSVWAVRRRK